jgi:hypothetical protein
MVYTCQFVSTEKLHVSFRQVCERESGAWAPWGVGS